MAYGVLTQQIAKACLKRRRRRVRCGWLRKRRPVINTRGQGARVWTS